MAPRALDRDCTSVGALRNCDVLLVVGDVLLLVGENYDAGGLDT